VSAAALVAARPVVAAGAVVGADAVVAAGALVAAGAVVGADAVVAAGALVGATGTVGFVVVAGPPHAAASRVQTSNTVHVETGHGRDDFIDDLLLAICGSQRRESSVPKPGSTFTNRFCFLMML
jgi:carbonic anhydrase/acetyltransferase-like protein (isoleucine patch superfamily)